MADSTSHLRISPNRKCFAVIIGNSDNKLSQGEWSSFVEDVDGAILEWEYERHFAGGPATRDKYQNYCWVIEIDSSPEPGGYDRSDIDSLKDDLETYRRRYDQTSILFAEVTPAFIED